MQAAESAAALDSLAAGVFVLTARGDIIRANAAGEAMLATASVLRKLNGRLELTDAVTNRSLRAALAAAEDGDVALSGKGSSIPLRGDDGEEFIVHMLPLNLLRQKSIEAGPNATMVIFVTQSDSDDATAIAAFAERFGLTSKEAEVLKTVVEVGVCPWRRRYWGFLPQPSEPKSPVFSTNQASAAKLT